MHIIFIFPPNTRSAPARQPFSGACFSATLKSLGTFCRFGSLMVTLPVAVWVSATPWIRFISSPPRQNTLALWSGKTIFDTTVVNFRHSKITPAMGWCLTSFSKMSLAELNLGRAVDRPVLELPRLLVLGATPGSPDGGRPSSTKSTLLTSSGEVRLKGWPASS